MAKIGINDFGFFTVVCFNGVQEGCAVADVRFFAIVLFLSGTQDGFDVSDLFFNFRLDFSFTSQLFFFLRSPVSHPCLYPQV